MADFADQNRLALNPADRWLFRWRFEFANGRPPVIGGWHPASRVEDMASSVNKDGLLWALIEGKQWTTKEVRVFAECPGPDFINFQHLTACVMRTGMIIHHRYGMRIVGRNTIFTAFENGTVLNEPNNESGPNVVYPEWTRF